MKHRGYVAVVLVAAVAVCVGLAAQEKAPAPNLELPPCVVKTEPANRAVDVDTKLREIKVTFDRPMTTEKSWSWIIHTEHGLYPGYRGSPEPRWEDDGRTCVLAVRLSPDTVYAVGVNSYRHTGFRDTNGKPAVPFAWVFKTAR